MASLGNKKIIFSLIIILLVINIFCFLLINPVRAYESLGNPLAGGKTEGVGIPTLIGRVAQGVIGLVGGVVFVIVIIAGIQWMVASGNEEKVGRAKKTLLWSLLGLVIIFSAYTLISFIIQTITLATGVGGPGT